MKKQQEIGDIHGEGKLVFRRRWHPLEDEGRCSACLVVASPTGHLDGVIIEREQKPELPSYYFLCLACARAIGRCAQ